MIMHDEFYINENEDNDISSDSNCPRCGLRTYESICPACGTSLSTDKKDEEEEDEYYERRKERR